MKIKLTKKQAGTLRFVICSDRSRVNLSELNPRTAKSLLSRGLLIKDGETVYTTPAADNGRW